MSAVETVPVVGTDHVQRVLLVVDGAADRLVEAADWTDEEARAEAACEPVHTAAFWQSLLTYVGAGRALCGTPLVVSAAEYVAEGVGECVSCARLRGAI